ncbi:MAG: ion channel, partial [Sphingomonadales bacterium]
LAFFSKKADKTYQALLISLVLLILLPGFVEGMFWANRLLDLGLFGVFIFGALTVKTEKRLFLPLIFFAGLAIITRGVLWFIEEVWVASAYLFSTGTFLLFILFVFSRDVFLTKKIDANIIYGSVCIYFFFGTLMAIVYMTIVVLNPGAFAFPFEPSENASSIEISQLRNLFYYSFVTQTTLGFGDITPVAPIAKNLSILQAITGQLYIAILIARLMGLYLVQKK